jgi:hypothetical protein
LGGKIEFGGKVIEREGNFVEPTIVTGLAHDAPGQFFNQFLIHAALCFQISKQKFQNN